jgi:hypothetical protein
MIAETIKEQSVDKPLQTQFNYLWSSDRDLQNKAFSYILDATDQPVDWAYEVWNTIVEQLRHPDNHNRAIAAQVLCNLAKSDPDLRIQKDFKALLNVTRDERFVTARHCLQAIWKVGAAGRQQKQLLVAGLESRFRECQAEKNCTLIRYDILQSLRNVYDASPDETIKAKALELIELEDDPKYRKKYAGLWREKRGAGWK